MIALDKAHLPHSGLEPTKNKSIISGTPEYLKEDIPIIINNPKERFFLERCFKKFCLVNITLNLYLFEGAKHKEVEENCLLF